MNTTPLILFLITITSSLISLGSIASSQHNTIILTPQTYTQLLVAHHPKLRELQLQSKSKEFAKKLSDTFGYTYSSSINTITEELSNKISAKNKDGSISSANHLLKRVDNNISNNYTSSLQLKHTIPLLKNKNGINDNLAIDLATINIQVDTLTKQKSINTFITTELRKLVNLAFYIEKLNILKKRNALDIKELKIITDKYKENLVDKTDVLLQESTIASNQIEITSTKKTIEKITQAIKTKLDISDFSLNFDLYATPAQDILIPNVETLISQQVKELEIKKRERELLSLHNQEEEQIDFSVRALFSGSHNKAFSSVTKSSPEFGIGLEVALPLYSDTEYYQIASKNNEIAIIKEQIKVDTITNTSILENIISDINKTLELMTTSQNQIRINEERYKEYQALYNDNNTDLDFVLNANTALVNSKLGYIEYLKNYHLLLLDFKNAGL